MVASCSARFTSLQALCKTLDFRCESAILPRLFTHCEFRTTTTQPKAVTLGRQRSCHRGVRCDEPFLCARRFPRPLYCGVGRGYVVGFNPFSPSPWRAHRRFNCRSVPGSPVLCPVVTFVAWLADVHHVHASGCRDRKSTR